MDSAANRSSRRGPAAKPAIAVPLVAPGGQVIFNAALLSVAWAGQHVLAIQMPKMPSFPKFSFPNFGGKSEAAPVDSKDVVSTVPTSGAKVRAASSPQAATKAPTLAELQGTKTNVGIGNADGWKRFPARRMPGANMDPWKEISREITPKL